MTATDHPPPDEARLWPTALAGNREAFIDLVRPHIPMLLDDATHQLAYRISTGDLQEGDLTAAELVGETLLRAWRDRNRRPAGLPMRPWLIGTQYRVVDGLARREKRLRELLTISLEQPIPAEPLYDDDASFWEWYQPDAAERWEDIIPDPRSPLDLPVADLTMMEAERLPPLTRQVLVMHDEYRMTRADIATSLRISPDHAAGLLAQGRRGVLAGREDRAEGRS